MLQARDVNPWNIFYLLLFHLSLCCQIDYFNNQIIVDLVEQQHKGIFSVLDEACMNVGKVTDELFLQGLNSKLAKHAHYTSRKVGTLLSPHTHTRQEGF